MLTVFIGDIALFMQSIFDCSVFGIMLLQFNSTNRTLIVEYLVCIQETNVLTFRQ